MSLFENKAVIVTGGSSGIGKATAHALAARKAKVVVADLSVEEGEKVVAEIREKGGTALFIKTNVAEDAAIRSVIDHCIAEYGRLDMMVNNAGIGGPFATFEDITDADWDAVMAVNAKGVFFCLRAALKIMKEMGGGSIVNVASVAGISSAPGMGAYAASKHAVVGMTKAAAAEYGKYGIRVNAVCPTVINTPMAESFVNAGPEVTDFIRKAIPLKRFGEPEEVAQTIVWLLSDEASFISGTALRVDGGHRA